MRDNVALRQCPDCEELMHYAFDDTSGVGAWKLGGGFATTPDSAHYICFYCAKAWKQRLDGPLTPDMIGEITFFTCRATDCGARLEVVARLEAPTLTRTISLARPADVAPTDAVDVMQRTIAATTTAFAARAGETMRLAGASA